MDFSYYDHYSVDSYKVILTVLETGLIFCGKLEALVSLVSGEFCFHYSFRISQYQQRFFAFDLFFFSYNLLN
jgi:hypothetical protein